MTATVNWALYRAFLAVMEHGTLSGAARQLETTQPTVGRYMSELEAALGVSLFVRTQTGLIATSVAHELVPQAKEMASIAAAMERQVIGQRESSEHLKGVVRISASEVVGVEILPQVLAGFRKSHPDITIELMASDIPHDLLHREADVAIRMFRPKQVSLIARRVGQLKLGFFAHQSYLEDKGDPEDIAALSTHTLIGFDTVNDYIRANAKKFAIPLEREFFQYRSDNTLTQLALIRSGVGIGVCQVALAQKDPNLVRLFASDFELPLEVWITMHEDLKRSSVCKAVFDYLSSGLQKHCES